MSHPIDYLAREVNPNDTNEFWPSDTRFKRGGQWNSHFTPGRFIQSLSQSDEAFNLYRVMPDLNPAPQPDGSYNRGFSDAFVNNGIQNEASYIQETITWVQRDSQTLFNEAVTAAQAHRQIVTLGDLAANNGGAQARLTYNAQDYWVVSSLAAHMYYNAIDLWLRNNTVPGSKPVPVLIERVSNGNIIVANADDALWTEFTKLLGRDFFLPAAVATGRIFEAAEAARDADDQDTLWQIQLGVRANWSGVVPGSFVDSRTFSVSGDHTAELERGVQVEIQQTQWVWGRVQEATFDGSLTTCICDFRNSDIIANEAMQVQWDLWGWPEYRAWNPGDDASDPDQVTVALV